MRRVHVESACGEGVACAASVAVSAELGSASAAETLKPPTPPHLPALPPQALLAETSETSQPEDESEPLRVGGRLLASEISGLEAQFGDAVAARGSVEGKIAELETALAGTVEERLKLVALLERPAPPNTDDEVDRKVQSPQKEGHAREPFAACLCESTSVS